MVKPSGPGKPVGTGVVPVFDIRCSHGEVRFRFYPVEKIAETEVHTIILAVAGKRCNA